jgi:hypothetical protein
MSTSTISGASEIEDAFLYAHPAGKGLNYGAHLAPIVGRGPFSAGGDQVGRTAVRVDETAIPAGTINTVTFYIYQAASSYSQNAQTGDCHAIKSGNDWVEGTSNGSAESGACCWDYAKISSQDWLGSTAPTTWPNGGCGSSGTDFDASGICALSWPAKTGGADALLTHTFSSVTEWTEWRDGDRDNEGFLMRTPNEAYPAAQNSWLQFRSTEAASNNPYFEVDYTSGSAGYLAHDIPGFAGTPFIGQGRR